MKKLVIACAFVFIIPSVALFAQKKKAKVVNLSGTVTKSEKHTVSYKKIGPQSMSTKGRRKRS